MESDIYLVRSGVSGWEEVIGLLSYDGASLIITPSNTYTQSLDINGTASIYGSVNAVGPFNAYDRAFLNAGFSSKARTISSRDSLYLVGDDYGQINNFISSGNNSPSSLSHYYWTLISGGQTIVGDDTFQLSAPAIEFSPSYSYESVKWQLYYDSESNFTTMYLYNPDTETEISVGSMVGTEGTITFEDIGEGIAGGSIAVSWNGDDVDLAGNFIIRDRVHFVLWEDSDYTIQASSGHIDSLNGTLSFAGANISGQLDLSYSAGDEVGGLDLTSLIQTSDRNVLVAPPYNMPVLLPPTSEAGFQEVNVKNVSSGAYTIQVIARQGDSLYDGSISLEVGQVVRLFSNGAGQWYQS